MLSNLPPGVTQQMIDDQYWDSETLEGAVDWYNDPTNTDINIVDLKKEHADFDSLPESCQQDIIHKYSEINIPEEDEREE